MLFYHTIRISHETIILMNLYPKLWSFHFFSNWSELNNTFSDNLMGLNYYR